MRCPIFNPHKRENVILWVGDRWKSGKNGNPTKVGTPIGAWNASPKVAAAYIYV